MNMNITYYRNWETLVNVASKKDISAFKNLVINGITYKVRYCAGFYQFYPQRSQSNNFNWEKLNDFVKSLGLVRTEDFVTIHNELGNYPYLAFKMDRDTFEYLLNDYKYFVEEFLPEYKENYGDVRYSEFRCR